MTEYQKKSLTLTGAVAMGTGVMIGAGEVATAVRATIETAGQHGVSLSLSSTAGLEVHITCQG